MKFRKTKLQSWKYFCLVVSTSVHPHFHGNNPTNHGRILQQHPIALPGSKSRKNIGKNYQETTGNSRQMPQQSHMENKVKKLYSVIWRVFFWHTTYVTELCNHNIFVAEAFINDVLCWKPYKRNALEFLQIIVYKSVQQTFFWEKVIKKHFHFNQLWFLF